MLIACRHPSVNGRGSRRLTIDGHFRLGPASWEAEQRSDLSSVGLNDRFRHPESGHVGECVIGLLEPIASADHAVEWQPVAVLSEEQYSANHVTERRSPLSPNVGVLSVDVEVRVDRDGAGIGIVSGDHVSATISKERQAFGYRFRVAGRSA